MRHRTCIKCGHDAFSAEDGRCVKHMRYVDGSSSCGCRCEFAPAAATPVAVGEGEQEHSTPEQMLTTRWDETNARRHALIDAKQSRELSEDEAAELRGLQWLAGLKRELANGPLLPVFDQPSSEVARDDVEILLRSWLVCMQTPRPQDWEAIVENLCVDTSRHLESDAVPVAPCRNCGHAERHNADAGAIADACPRPDCNCGYYEPNEHDSLP